VIMRLQFDQKCSAWKRGDVAATRTASDAQQIRQIREEELVALQILFEASILRNYFSILQRLRYAGWTKEEIEAARHTADNPDDVPSLTYHPMFRQAAALTQTGTSIQS
jgi:hypothetical protein